MFDTPEENRAELDELAAYDAVVMGRNMFGPVRGGWDRPWNGWWGDDPCVFHAPPVFVLTHHAREPPADGRRHDVPLRHRPRHSRRPAGAGSLGRAGEGDVLASWVAPETINQYLTAGMVDELRLHLVPRSRSGRVRGCSRAVAPLQLEQVKARAVRPVVTHVNYRVLT